MCILQTEREQDERKEIGGTMDFIEKEYQLPVVKINFEDLKAEIEKVLVDYTGLIVTEETLAGGKAAQKELASLRTKIDTYRKEKKKELEAPIKEFEAQCKELVSMIEQAEKPIKEGIKAFDDRKREEKRQKAMDIIAEEAEKAGLNEKYRVKLTCLDKYANLTATEKAVREDVETRAFALKVEQDREQEQLDIIQSVIDGENAKISTKLQLSEFRYLIELGMSTAEIIKQIKESAEKIYAAEHPAPVEVTEEEAPVNPLPEEAKKPEPVQAPSKPAKNYKVVIEVIEPAERIRDLGTFLKTNGYNYKVVERVEA